MFRRAAATCVVVAAVAAAARGAAAAPLGEGSEVLLPGPDFAAPVGDGDGVAVAARGAAPRRLSLGALLAPLHEALRGVWAAPHVLLRDGAGARDRARESELGARNRTVGDFLAFLEAGRVSGVLLLEALPPGAARAFYDDALLGGGWSGGCAACSAHVYVSPPGLSALRNHTDATPVRVFQLTGAKDWRACAAAPAPALAVPLDFAAKLGTCATYDAVYDAGEMADATSDRALGLLDCASFSLAAGESVSVPRRTVHAARAAAGAPSVHVTVGFRDDAAAPACAAPGGGGGDDLPDGRRLDCVDSNVESYATCCPAGTHRAGTGRYDAGYDCDESCDLFGGLCDTSCDGCNGCSGCPAGSYSGACAVACASCAAGTYQPSAWQAACLACPSGSYQSSATNYATACTTCPAGTFAAGGAASCSACAAGYYTAGGAAECSSCAAGTYAPTTGYGSCLACPAGSYAAAAAASCAACPAGTYSSAGAASCSSCAAGLLRGAARRVVLELRCAARTYAPSTGYGSCLACPAGHSSHAGATSCYSCAAGTYAAAEGSASCADCAAGSPPGRRDGQASCAACAAGSYAGASGATACAACAAGTSSSAGAIACARAAGTYSLAGSPACATCGADGHWDVDVTGVPARDDCACEDGWTGYDCDIVECAETLHAMSLGLMLVEASWPEPTRTMSNARVTWAAILRAADLNADEVLSGDELAYALAWKSVDVPAGVANVWSRQSHEAGRPGTWTRLFEGDVSISEMIADLVAYRTTPTLKFGADTYVDGATSLAELGVTSMNATYPDPAWAEAECAAREDGSGTTGVTVAWTLRADMVGALYQQCAFVNGAQIGDAGGFFDSLVDGTDCDGGRCEFHDARGIAAGNRKRVLCVEVDFCASADACDAESVDTLLTATRCATALAYDGAPADVVPALEDFWGVTFSWLDTSLDEAGFYVFRTAGDEASAAASPVLIAQVPTPSARCGRFFSPVAFNDRDTGQNPGTVVQYTVATVDAAGAVLTAATVEFTSPWLSELEVAVETESEAPVEGVTVAISHLTSEGDRDAKYDPLVSGVTNVFGVYVVELRVTDYEWQAQSQNMVAVCSKTSATSAGAVVEHVFEPAEQRFSQRHFRENVVEIVDETSVSVTGYVRYNFTDAPGSGGAWDSGCPHRDGAARCYCPLPHKAVTVKVEDDQGTVTDVAPNEAGYFATGVTYGHRYKVYLQAFEGEDGSATRAHEFRMTSDAGDLAVDAVAEGAAPLLDFFADADVAMEFVHAESTRLDARVVGGDGAAAFATGQLVEAYHGECGFTQTLRTHEGYATALLPAAGAFDVTLVAGARAEALPPCASLALEDVVDPYAAAAVASCRVEMPRGVGSETRPCFDGGFDYVDEFFDAVGDAERSVTLAALNGTETITYAFAANLCVEGVAIAPKAGTALQALFGAHAGPREVPLPGDEALLLVPPLPIEGPEVYGSACPDATTAIFVEDDEFDLSFELGEYYPNTLGLRWPWDYFESDGVTRTAQAYVVTQPSAAHAVDVAVFDGISKTDGVSGVYDASASAHGFVHAVAAADPNPFAPFTLGIEVQFSRDVDGAAATLSRSAIVLGVLPDDVPQTFAMTTEPTLVWTILRDPPGGASTATLEQGSEVGTSMGIEGMHSGTFERGDDWGLTQGAGADLTSALEPLGFGVQTSIFQIGYTTGAAHGAVKPIIGVERGSSQSFDFSFAFDFAVSTSEEPTIAGQASDLILGGGANLRVLTAIEIALAGFTLESVALYEEGDPLCVAGNTTYEWLPTQVTTYLLTAYEVEHTMDRLAALDQTAATGLAIENWVAVLANYRASTFSNAEVLQHTLDFTLDAMIAKFADFQAETEGADSADDTMISYLTNGIGRMESVRSQASYEEISPNPASMLLHTITHASEAVSDFNDVDVAEVHKLTDHVWRHVRESRANCQGSDAFGLGRLCEDIPALESKAAVVHEAMGLCDFESDVPAVAAFCDPGADGGYLPRSPLDFLSSDSKLVTFSGGSVLEMSWSIGETRGRESTVGYSLEASDEYSGESQFCMALGRRLAAGDRARARRAFHDRLRAGAAVGASMANVAKSAQKAAAADAAEAADAAQAAVDAPGAAAAEGIARLDAYLRATLAARAAAAEAALRRSPWGRRRLGISFGVNFNSFSSASVSVNMGRSNAKEHSRSHTVAIAFSDGEPGDFFAVKVEGDSHYGTPIFTTMGGLSSCPGETGTTKVDDRVTIAKIEYHCDPSSFVPSADCRDNLPGSTVAVGVIVQNLSPAWTVVTYQLMLGGDYASADPWFDGMYHYTDERCGREGASNGLNVEVAGDPVRPPGYTLDEIPYGQTEVLLLVSEVDCHEYVDIPVKVVSECEFNGDTYQNDPYQYLTELDTSGASSSSSGLAVVHPVWVPDDLAFDEDTLPGGLAGDEATFSVHWIAATWAPTPTEPPTTAAHFSEAAAGTRAPSENPNVPTLSTAPSLAPTTPSPTKAPSRSMVAFNLVLEVGYEAVGATAAAYCAAYEAVGLDAIQEALVASYVEAEFAVALPYPPYAHCDPLAAARAPAGGALNATATAARRPAPQRHGGPRRRRARRRTRRRPRAVAGAAANGTGGRRGLQAGDSLGDLLAGSTVEDVAVGALVTMSPSATPTTAGPTATPTTAEPSRAPTRWSQLHAGDDDRRPFYEDGFLLGLIAGAFLLGCLTAGAAVHALSRRAPAAAPDAKKQVELPTFGTTASAAARKFSTEQTDTASNPMRAGHHAPSPKKHHEARHHASKKGSHEHRKKSAEPPKPPHKTNPFTVARAAAIFKTRGEASHWVECSDLSSGQVYYSNTKTGETTWTKPSGYHGPEAIAPGGKAKWLEAHDPKSGLPFYTNAATGETTWDRPKGVEIKPAPAKGARTRTLSADTKKFADI
ncbi:calcium ion binding protein [Aureococcus anophagefferens]|uniref:Calcium ion binding protein n=1 Tax=Aureococcus anophagefferens TaxID=44056 RepID=A0ABR1G806_AURAN